MTVSVSDDRENWKEIGKGEFPEPSGEDADSPSVASVPLKAEARYVRVKVARAERAQRLMLSEVAFTPPPTQEMQLSEAKEGWRGPVAPPPREEGPR